MAEANDFITKLHRHSKKVRGCKFCLGAMKDNKLVGILVLGRPVARKLDNRYTAEVLRTCSDGTKNVNSFLYAKAWNIWQQMGGNKILTYTLEKESGISLKACGFEKEASQNLLKRERAGLQDQIENGKKRFTAKQNLDGAKRITNE